MLRWRWVLFLWVLAAILVLLGVWIELEVRYEIGSGPYRWMAIRLWRGDVVYWREMALACLISGPVLFLLGFLLRRHGGDGAQDEG